ncbi:porin PorA family protein [Rhodococcus sp. CSLK01-03]|uniref:Porin PorA family protein n=1 Tax=Rhodococcus indonesiensis TaxID=3055869 RepID=A0ABT7RTD9_9NOCA|nr:porin PorA family protein [Rhodococcus indonesiensis]MDM7490918.1 porin PorA family protein [Rhodococcus indonesiensis]
MFVRRSSTIFLAVGVLFIALAALVRFVLVPTLSKLPGDLDVNPVYEGTGTLLNAEALQTGDIANMIASDVPVTIDRHIYVSSTDGDTAIAHDDSILAAAGLSVPSNHTYALDRKTMDATNSDAGEGIEPHSGMTIALPLQPDPSASYKYYDATTRTTVPMTYLDSGTVVGRDVLNYSVEAKGILRDPAIAGTLPPALPKALVGSLARLLPADVQQSLGGALGQLADPVPFTYTAATRINLAADQTLGSPIDAQLNQEILANVEIGGQLFPVLSVLSIDAALTDQSISDAAASAKSQSIQLNLISVVTPIVLFLLGVLALLVGLLRRRLRSVAPSPVSRANVSVR